MSEQSPDQRQGTHAPLGQRGQRSQGYNSQGLCSNRPFQEPAMESYDAYARINLDPISYPIADSINNLHEY